MTGMLSLQVNGLSSTITNLETASASVVREIEKNVKKAGFFFERKLVTERLSGPTTSKMRS